MAIRIVNKVGVADTQDEISATVQDEGTIVYCVDNDITIIFTGGIWVEFDNEQVYTLNPVPASTIETDSNHRLVTDVEKTTWNAKQAALVSGSNIKTINGTSVLGSGDITISGSGLSQQQIEGLI